MPYVYSFQYPQSKHHIRIKEMSVEEALNSINNWRFKVFRAKRPVCRVCNISAQFCSVEFQINQLKRVIHYNLYAIKEYKRKKKLIPITIDHTIPKSRCSASFKNDIRNLEPMCAICNSAKKDNMPNKKYLNKINFVYPNRVDLNKARHKEDSVNQDLKRLLMARLLKVRLKYRKV